jgi:hypothetical protein
MICCQIQNAERETLRLYVIGIQTSLKKDGAQGRNRTTDTMIFSHVLYRLSYLGTQDHLSRPAH